jgi:hypothetical protein
MKAMETLLDVVHGGDSFLCVIFIGVSHEAESSAPTRVTVFDNHLSDREKP